MLEEKHRALWMGGAVYISVDFDVITCDSST